jgi:hypothetical protein
MISRYVFDAVQVNYYYYYYYYYYSIDTTTLVGFRLAELSLSILSRKVLLSAVASGTSNPNLEDNQGFRAFQLSPQEAPSV